MFRDDTAHEMLAKVRARVVNRATFVACSAIERACKDDRLIMGSRHSRESRVRQYIIDPEDGRRNLLYPGISIAS